MSKEKEVVETAFNKLYDAVVKGKKFSEQEKEEMNIEAEALRDVPIAIIQEASEKFLNLDILKSDFSVLKDLKYWDYIYYGTMSLVN